MSNNKRSDKNLKNLNPNFKLDETPVKIFTPGEFDSMANQDIPIPNPFPLIPKGMRIIVRPIAPPDKQHRVSGIILHAPEENNMTTLMGVVVAVSKDMELAEEKYPESDRIKVGSKVVFNAFSNAEVIVKQCRYRYLMQGDIMSVIVGELEVNQADIDAWKARKQGA